MADGPEELVGRPGRSLFGIVRLAEVDGVLTELAAQGFEGEMLQPHDADTWRAGLQGGGVAGQVRQLFAEDGIEKGLRYSEQRADEAVIRVHAPARRRPSLPPTFGQPAAATKPGRATSSSRPVANRAATGGVTDRPAARGRRPRG